MAKQLPSSRSRQSSVGEVMRSLDMGISVMAQIYSAVLIRVQVRVRMRSVAGLTSAAW